MITGACRPTPGHVFDDGAYLARREAEHVILAASQMPVPGT
jgi:hypothetical protein